MSWEIMAELDYPVFVRYNKTRHTQFEELHGRHDLSHWQIEIKEVFLDIGDKSIDITKLITPDMEKNLIYRIETEDNDL